MTPQTDREWAKALAAVHPDIGGDPARFVALYKQRAQWRVTQPRLCQECWLRPIPQRNDDRRRGPGRFCSQTCANRGINRLKRKPRRLRG
jgi:hypothetical protein